jgi:hypothetical protein
MPAQSLADGYHRVSTDGVSDLAQCAAVTTGLSKYRHNSSDIFDQLVLDICCQHHKMPRIFW